MAAIFCVVDLSVLLAAACAVRCTSSGDLQDRAGNIAGFKRCLQAHRHALINLGIYLTLEKVHAIVLRNLLRRTYELSLFSAA